MDSKSFLAGLIGCACVLSISAGAAGAAPQLGDPVALPGDLAPEPSAGEQQTPWIARGADGYLVVWEDARSSLTGTVQAPDGFHPNSDVYAARLDASGALLDASPIVVTQASFDQDVPRVAWNGESYLVVWRSKRLTAGWTTNGIYAARVSPAGQVLDDPPILIDDEDSIDEFRPVVASNGSEWVVLWKDVPASGSVDVIDGARVSAQGVVVEKRRVVTPPVQSEFPTNYELAFAGGRYMLGYERSFSGGIAFRFFDPLLNQLGVQVNVGIGVRPRVASNGSGFFLQWRSGHMYGTPVALDGTMAVPGGRELSTGTSVGSTGSGATWDGSRWVSVWGNGLTVSGAQVTPAGALVAGSPFAILSGALTAVDPVVGGGNGLALAAWTDRRSESFSIGIAFDVYAATIEAGPSVSPSYPLTVSPPAQFDCDLAGEREAGYLAVFVSEVSSELRVKAQRLDGLGAPLDAEPLELAAGPRIRHPRVAWNGDAWCVVWEDLALGTFAQRIGADGVPLDPAPIAVQPGNAPDVAALGGTFLVVSSYEPTNHFRYVIARRLDGTDGSFPDASYMTVSGNYSTAPAVEGLAGRWIVAWQRASSHDSPFTTIKAALVPATGAPQAEFFVEDTLGSSDRTPRIALGDTKALLVWEDADVQEVRARRIDRDGILLGDSQGVLVTGIQGRQFEPTVGWTGAEFLVAWTDHRSQTGLEPGIGDVYAARVLEDGTLLDFPSGMSLAADAVLVEGDAAVAGGGGFAVSAYSVLSTQLGALRIELRGFEEPSVGDRYCFGDGAGAPCPCANEAAGSAGCANGTGFGAGLSGAGSASVAAADLTFAGAQLPSGQPALLFAGNSAVAGGNGIAFGDGLRCAGGGVVRLGVRTAQLDGAATWGPSLAGGWSAGDVARFQAWYRDPVASPCGGGFNLSNGVEVLFEL